MEKNTDRKLVIKNNRLIEFKGRLTKNELQLFSLIMANVHEDEANLTKYKLLDFKVDIAELRETTTHKDFFNYLKETAFGACRSVVSVMSSEELLSRIHGT